MSKLSNSITLEIKLETIGGNANMAEFYKTKILEPYLDELLPQLEATIIKWNNTAYINDSTYEVTSQEKYD